MNFSNIILVKKNSIEIYRKDEQHGKRCIVSPDKIENGCIQEGYDENLQGEIKAIS